MAKHKIAVIGLGHFGLNMCLDLTAEGAEVIAIDRDEEKVELLRDKVSYPVCLDSTDFRALQALGLSDMDICVVSIGEDFESSIMTVAHLQELQAKRIIGRVISPVHERLLRLMKVEELVLPEKEAAHRLSKNLTNLGLLTSTKISPEYSIVECAAPKFVIGKSLGDVNLRENYKINLVTIKKIAVQKALLTRREKEKVEIIGVPDREYIFSENDILVVFGHEKYIRRFINE